MLGLSLIHDPFAAELEDFASVGDEAETVPNERDELEDQEEYD